MIKHIIIIISLLFLAYIIVSYLRKTNKNIDINDRIIHDPEKNRSYFIKGYNDDEISQIQLSLNKRNKVYFIKDNILFYNNKFKDNLTLF